jgi:hypothetical protein
MCRPPVWGAIAAGGGRVADPLSGVLFLQASSLASDAALEEGVSDGRCILGSKRHGDG